MYLSTSSHFAKIFNGEDTTRLSRNQRSADSLVRAKLASGEEHADKAVRASEKSSRDATILRDSTAKVFAEAAKKTCLRVPLRQPLRPLRLIVFLSSIHWPGVSVCQPSTINHQPSTHHEPNFFSGNDGSTTADQSGFTPRRFPPSRPRNE